MSKAKQIIIVITAGALVLAILMGIIAATVHRDTNPIASTGNDLLSSEPSSAPTQTQASSAPTQTETSATESTATEPPVTEPPVTEPPVTEPPVTEPPVTEPPVTEPPVTEPPVTEPPATVPTEPAPDGSEMIGALYTRDQLAAIDGNRRGYGPGPSTNGSRPPYATSAQNAYGQRFNSYFIAPDNGKVYFTFNHGYEMGNLTATVLDVLKEKDVKCVFFINRYYAKSAPDLVWRMINEGHIVASHATNHYDMGTLSVDKMVSEIMTMHNYMLEHFGYKMTLFRPPSCYYSPRLLAVAQSLGYTTVQCSYMYPDYEETAPPDHDKFLASVVNSAHSGAIYQFHSVTASGVSILAEAIDAIREKGYEFAQFTGTF